MTLLKNKNRNPRHNKAKANFIDTRLRSALFLALLAVGLALVLGLNRVGPAYAVDFTVTRADDPPPNGCNVGDCSLREAIIEANATAGAETIVLSAGTYTLGIPGTGENAAATGDLDISDDLTLTGEGPDVTIIDGGGLDRVLHIHPGSTVEISGLTIRNGDAGAEDGGGIRTRGGTTTTLTNVTVSGNTSTAGNGGGIRSSGLLTIADSTISDNSADFGGGLINTLNSTLTITDSTVSNNTAQAGGGLFTNGTVTVSGSTISNNTADSGGGIFPKTGTLDLSDSTISGNSAIVSTGGGIFDDFAIVTVTNSLIQANRANTNGGGIYNNNDDGTLDITNSTIFQNTALGDGGGVYHNNSLDITNSTINENIAHGDGGGIYNVGGGALSITDSTISRNSGDNGGGVRGGGTLTITNSAISDNSADFGGGLINTLNSTLTMANSTVSGNTADSGGGGMFTNGAVIVSGSAVSNNTANSGGGIFPKTGTLDLSNSTISGNSANNRGGGILNDAAGTTLTNVTVSNNSASAGGGIRSAGAGTVDLTNTIVAANPMGGDCSGLQITSNDHNLDSDGTCLFNPMPADIPNANPHLGPLQNNGGPTGTHALLPGSPAIDTGDNATCATFPINNLDQRGLPRPVDGNNDSTATCDMGAYELQQPANPNSPLGTNLSRVADWSTELSFVDAFKMTRAWIPQCVNTGPDPDPECNNNNSWDTGEADLIEVDENGWVTSLPAPEDDPIFTRVGTVLMLGDAEGQNNVGGQYIVLYEGEGGLEYGMGADKDDGLSAPGRDVVNVADTGFVHLVITATHPISYIRDIRFIRPEYEETYETQLFNPAFLEMLANFSVIRFMNWMATNREPTGEWAERAQVSDYTYTTNDGVPLEMMIELSNRTQTAPWFNMPHAASDEYMTEFAAMVRDNLSSNLPVYVEYSNETWNPDFPQFTHVISEGLEIFETDSPYQAALNWHGKRAAEMCQMWKTVWGEQSERVICIAASQAFANSSWTAEQVLDCPLWDEVSSCVEHGSIDALAIAPYFGRNLVNTDFDDLDQLFDEIFNSALPLAYQSMSDNRAVADDFGVELIAYEGGQHLVGNDLFTDANQDPRMGLAYTQYLTEWRQHGCLFTHFKLEGGNWGLIEFINQASGPKFGAVMNFIDDNPGPWEDCPTSGRAPGEMMNLYLPVIMSWTSE